MPGWIALAVVGVLGMPCAVRAQGPRNRGTAVVLDTLIRKFWRAHAAADSVTLKELSVGEGPRRVAYLFDGMAPAEAERVRVRRTPRFQVRGDTAWRSYTSPWGEYHALLPYQVRFERRCGRWRIVAISYIAQR
jgi:hypothetical protein